MKILVGTLYSGENEFEECVASIQKQSIKGFEHLVVQDKPNREAHRLLFQTFMTRKDEFDALIKVDADMVLCHENLFEQIDQWLARETDLEILTIAVLDFFSGQLINGLNTYRNTVTWNLTKETLFVDIAEVDLKRTHFDTTYLAPAAIHCKNPSSYQAFHYGVHRGFKSIARQHSTTHWALLEKTWQNFLLTRDVRIGLAILGAELVYAGEFSRDDIDYTNPKVKNMLEKYLPLDASGVEKEIRELRIRNWGFLPGDLRRRVVRYWRSKN